MGARDAPERSGTPPHGPSPSRAPAPESARSVSAEEMRALSAPILDAQRGLHAALGRERRHMARLAGLTAAAFLALVVLPSLLSGNRAPADLVAVAVVLALVMLPLAAPDVAVAVARRWLVPASHAVGLPSSAGATLYGSVSEVHDARRSAVRLRVATLVLGVLFALFATFAGLEAALGLLILASPPAGSVPPVRALLIPLLGGAAALGGSVAWVVHRTSRLEHLERELERRLAWLERLEHDFWSRF